MQVEKMANLRNDLLTKWQVDKIALIEMEKNGKLTKCKIDTFL